MAANKKPTGSPTSFKTQVREMGLASEYAGFLLSIFQEARKANSAGSKKELRDFIQGTLWLPVHSPRISDALIDEWADDLATLLEEEGGSGPE